MWCSKCRLDVETILIRFVDNTDVRELKCKQCGSVLRNYESSEENVDWFREGMRNFEAKCSKILQPRGADYNSGSIDIPDYFPFEHKSYAQMCYLKALRLVSLCHGEVVDGEKIEETLIDLHNYTVFHGAYCNVNTHPR